MRGAHGHPKTQAPRALIISLGLGSDLLEAALAVGPLGEALLQPPPATRPLPTFDGGRGRTAELREFLPQHGSQLLVQLGVVEERGQVAVLGG